jgi:hypothetical protein
MAMGIICDYCGDEFDRIGTHWRYNPDHRPNLTQEQLKICKGLLMGDGHLNRSDNTPRLRCTNSKLKYLKHLHNKFNKISTEPVLHKTAEELAERNRKNGPFSTTNEENYSNCYWWETVAHPDLRQFESWYSEGEKYFPYELSLSPKLLTHWYVGDGTLDNRWNPTIMIAASNESENVNKLKRMFYSSGLPEPTGVSSTERKDGSRRCNLYWSSDESMKLFDFMEGPLPGYEYKWPERYK